MFGRRARFRDAELPMRRSYARADRSRHHGGAGRIEHGACTHGELGIDEDEFRTYDPSIWQLRRGGVRGVLRDRYRKLGRRLIPVNRPAGTRRAYHHFTRTPGASFAAPHVAVCPMHLLLSDRDKQMHQMAKRREPS